MRIVALAEYNREMATLRGEGAPISEPEIDDATIAGFDDAESVEGLEDVSPELLFTADHEEMFPSQSPVEGDEESPPGETPVTETGDAASRRRRGRRGGRRGRGSDSGEH